MVTRHFEWRMSCPSRMSSAPTMTIEIGLKRRSSRAGPGKKVNDRLGSLSHVEGVIGGRKVDAVGAREREG
jgi:hypothetical protein